jgi:hypothetical protein
VTEDVAETIGVLDGVEVAAAALCMADVTEPIRSPVSWSCEIMHVNEVLQQRSRTFFSAVILRKRPFCKMLLRFH